MHTSKHAREHARTHTHTYIHIHTHIHTHAHIYTLRDIKNKRIYVYYTILYMHTSGVSS